MSKDRIPSAIIGILPEIFSSHYTHDKINSIFLSSNAPDEIPDGSKTKKVEAWLRLINNLSEHPLDVLGRVLEEFMDMEMPGASVWSFNKNNWEQVEEALAAEFQKPRNKITTTLAGSGLQYLRGGGIVSIQGISTQALKKSIAGQGLEAVNVEFQRATENLDKDPPAACLAAASILESVLKNYLDKENITYSDSDTLSDVWGMASKQLGLRPREWDDKDLKKIASGLFNIVEGLMNIRNRKSSAHGKSEKQLKTYNLLPRHARLAVHSAHTIVLYVLEK